MVREGRGRGWEGSGVKGISQLYYYYHYYYYYSYSKTYNPINMVKSLYSSVDHQF